VLLRSGGGPRNEVVVTGGSVYTHPRPTCRDARRLTQPGLTSTTDASSVTTSWSAQTGWLAARWSRRSSGMHSGRTRSRGQPTWRCSSAPVTATRRHVGDAVEKHTLEAGLLSAVRLAVQCGSRSGAAASTPTPAATDRCRRTRKTSTPPTPASADPANVALPVGGKHPPQLVLGRCLGERSAIGHDADSLDSRTGTGLAPPGVMRLRLNRQ